MLVNEDKEMTVDGNQNPEQPQAPQPSVYESQPGYSNHGNPTPPASEQPFIPGSYGPGPQASPVYGVEVVYPMTESDRTLRLVAFIFMVISCITAGWMIIPLAWLIPMTIITYGIYKGTRPNSVAFGVCTLIFGSLVAGILLLVSQKDR